MTTYHTSVLDNLTEEYVNGLCMVCGLPRRQCAEDREDPFVADTEEEA